MFKFLFRKTPKDIDQEKLEQARVLRSLNKRTNKNRDAINSLLGFPKGWRW